MLNLIGVAESAVVALVISCLHVLTLSMLTVASIVYTVQHAYVIRTNMHPSLSRVNFVGSHIGSNVFDTIFFSFGATMFSITDFESSAQFIEEQQPGVFRKTLRNMWAFSTFFNAALSIMALGVLPLDESFTNLTRCWRRSAVFVSGVVKEILLGAALLGPAALSGELDHGRVAEAAMRLIQSQAPEPSTLGRLVTER